MSCPSHRIWRRRGHRWECCSRQRSSRHNSIHGQLLSSHKLLQKKITLLPGLVDGQDTFAGIGDGIQCLSCQDTRLTQQLSLTQKVIFDRDVSHLSATGKLPGRVLQTLCDALQGRSDRCGRREQLRVQQPEASLTWFAASAIFTITDDSIPNRFVAQTSVSSSDSTFRSPVGIGTGSDML